MLKIDGITFNSHLLLGTAQYPSLSVLQQAIEASKTEIITLSLKRQNPALHSDNVFWETIKQANKHLLPNTAGCRTAKEAINLANMAREIFNTHWIKVEVIGNDYNLQPDPIGLLEATKELLAQGFHVFPYCTDDLVICSRLAELGCKILMPWAAPIGSGQGLLNPFALRTLRNHFKEITLIIDAGIGSPSQACQAMEMGFDGILLNTAVANAHDPVQMASAFKDAISAGYHAYLAGLMPKSDIANPSTPLTDTPFWIQDNG